jgi:hypothetical protein
LGLRRSRSGTVVMARLALIVGIAGASAVLVTVAVTDPLRAGLSAGRAATLSDRQLDACESK